MVSAATFGSHKSCKEPKLILPLPLFNSMASDFFYPNTGGVESHILHLGKCLIERGHKVIVITHAYENDFLGVRHMTNGLKVYYVPFLLIPKQNIIWPLVFHTLYCVSQILLSEEIDIVHGHSAFSPMAHEVMFHAKTLGINTVFTDHSLFGFDGIGTLILNEVVKLSLVQCNHLICVSHIAAQDKAIRVKTAITKVPISVIPNAVDSNAFTPDPNQRDPSKITIIVNSRLVYRKGIDLLAELIPKVCMHHSKVYFILAGDGPKRRLLEDTVQLHNLNSRVLFLGSIKHEHVRDVLVKGDIFLNTSLTEAFCIAIVEAASCGLQIVSTNVGGIPEVLPPKLIKLTEPSVDGLFEGVLAAIEDRENCVSPSEAHEIVKNLYCWKDVAKQTEQVYKLAIRQTPYSLSDRIKRFRICGWFASLLFIFVAIINHLLMIIIDIFQPTRRAHNCSARVARALR